MIQGKRLNTIDGATLMAQPLRPPNFIVDSLLSQGLHILAGSPKVGKSWLALWLAVTVAKGEPVWGMNTRQGTTLYLCLEDSQLRIQNRLFEITEDAPANVHFCTACGRVGSGLEEQLEQFLAAHPDTVLVIIDTLQLVRGLGYDMTYANDYRDLSILKQLADRHNLAILLIHHLRKMKDEDPMNMISSTTGISGATDSGFVLKETRRGSGVATLYCTGRDIEYRELKLQRNENNIWDLTGDSTERSTDIVSLLIPLLKNSADCIGTPTELVQRIDPVGAMGISPKKISGLILQNVAALEKAGISARTRRSNGKRLIELRRADSADVAGAGNIVPVDPPPNERCAGSRPPCEALCAPSVAQAGTVPAPHTAPLPAASVAELSGSTTAP